MKYKYNKVKDKKQFQTLISYNQDGIFKRLYFLMLKHLNLESYEHFIQLMKQFKKKKDDEIYKHLKKYLKKKLLGGYNLFSFYAKYLRKFSKNKKITNYLDFGCGSCTKTYSFGKALKLTSKQIHGCDISEWGDYSDKTRNTDNIQFTKIEKNKKLPYKTNTFDVISTMMVLHHVENISHTVKELSRILKNDGYLFIKEHDARNDAERMMMDIEHGLYEVVYRNNKDFYNSYFAIYYSIKQLRKILEKEGFQLLGKKYLHSNNPTNYYVCVYSKK